MAGKGDGPMYSHDRRDATATPLCGAHRGTRANPLLTKTQLGSVKATSYDLPADFQFTYGMQQVAAAPCARVPAPLPLASSSSRPRLALTRAHPTGALAAAAAARRPDRGRRHRQLG